MHKEQSRLMSGPSVVSKDLIGTDFILESFKEFISKSENNKNTFNYLKSVVEMVKNPSQENDFLDQPLSSWLQSLDSKSQIQSLKDLVQICVDICCKFPSLSLPVLEVVDDYIQNYPDQILFQTIAYELGKVGKSNEKYCKRIVQSLVGLSKRTQSIAVLKEISGAYFQIGASWSHKKFIFEPLLDMLKATKDKSLKVSIIRSMQTQIEGYWEKSIDVMKHMALHDPSYEVRCVATMALGDVGSYSSFSVREAVYELIDCVGHQVFQLKKDLMYQQDMGKKVFHDFKRLKESKEVLKLLYHYARVYKYRNAR